MDLILWRHAQAELGEPDFDRMLTPHGHKQAVKMSAWLDLSLPGNCRILSSPTMRTVQTVEKLGRKYKTLDALGPLADPREVIALAGWPDSRVPVLLVGHQPWLGQIASLLLTGTVQDWTVKKSNAWWISNRQRDEGNAVYLRAVFSPEFFIN